MEVFIYEVQKGDSIDRIAKKFYGTITATHVITGYYANRQMDYKNLKPGDRIQIPNFRTKQKENDTMTREEYIFMLGGTEENNKKQFLKEYAIRSKRLSSMTEVLEDIGYFICPAAKSHHGNHIGGLWEHSREVADQLYMLTKKLNLKWEREDSPFVIGLLHDLCKTNLYTLSFDEQEGNIQIGYNNERIIDGHGDLSVIMVQQHITLSAEEIMCIRHHMGAFVEEKERQYYSKAVGAYPNVLWTHTADMIASQIKNI